MNENMKVIEINGVKLEVDMRYAKRVETLAVGSRVKVLVKGYGDSFNVYPGVLIGFEPFLKLPTLVVAYLKIEYNNATLQFLSYNTLTKDTEVIAAESNSEGLELNRNDVIGKMDRDIAKKEADVEEAKRQKEYFLAQFATYTMALNTQESSSSAVELQSLAAEKKEDVADERGEAAPPDTG